MPDAVPAPAAPVATPAPVAATPEPVATPAPSAPQKTGKQSEHQRITEAARILAAAGSAKQSGAPAPADTPPTGEGVEEKPADKEKPEDEDQPRDITVAEWRKYKALKGKLEKREETILARETEYKLRDQAVAQANQRIAAFQQREKLLLQDPRAFWELLAKENGSDYVSEYEKFANAYIDTGKPESQAAAANKKIAELEQRWEQREQQAKQQQVEAQRSQLARSFIAIAAGEAHTNTQFTLRNNGPQTIMDDAVAVCTALQAQLGRMPTDPEVAKELDARYGAYYDAIEAGRKPAAAPSGAEQSANSERPQGVAPTAGHREAGNAVAPKAPTTLTNGGSAVRTASGAKLTEAQRIAAATALMPDMPRPRSF
jgi:hypothetical protein